MPFPYKHVLMVGATAGIGAAMADRLISEGAKVIAVGRRQNRIDRFVAKHGKDKASGIAFDISDGENTDQFVAGVTKDYPDLDCVFLNAGIQSNINLAEPKSFNFEAFHNEITTNFTSFVNLTMKFLPFLMGKPDTGLVYTGTHLAIVPAATLPAYSASKAALNSFVLCLRDQLRNTSVKVLEIYPPVVQTELHDYMGEEKGRSMGMDVHEFVDKAFKGLDSGHDQVIIGSVGPEDTYLDIVDKRRITFTNLAKMIRGEL